MSHDRMVARTAKKRHEVVAVGTSFLVPVQKIDRSNLLHQANVLAVVIEARVGNSYVLGTKRGILEGTNTTNRSPSSCPATAPVIYGYTSEVCAREGETM